MKALLEKIRKLLKDKRFRKAWYRFVSGFAAVVVFITTYALVLPAITLEKTAACGIEEHQHDESCYETRLVCGREESEGHHHDGSCYTVTQELDCSLEEHQHSADNGCYDAEGNLICEIPEHTHDSSCYKDVETLTCGQEESEGHHHTDACYEEVLVCGKEDHIHNTECYKEDSSAVAATDEAAGGASTVTSGESDSAGYDTVPVESAEDGTSGMTDTTEGQVLSDPSVPQLDPVELDAVLTKDTGFYYFHAEDDEEIPANSAGITDWQKVKKDTKLASTDLVKVYFAYKIPAGSLNGSNPVARYRLPGSIHLTDEQIEAINLTENGVYASMDQEAEAESYLGAEAVEGDRKPDEELVDGVQEYISAVVRAENIFDEEGRYLGQDLIFTFVPYTIEKNQNTYDADGSQLTAGEKITGWFACDFNMSQIDWVEDETDLDNSTAEKSAEVVFVEEDRETGRKEISTILNLVETDSADDSDNMDANGEDSEDASNDNSEDDKAAEAASSEDTAEAASAGETDSDAEGTNVSEYKSGTLTADGDGYKITLDYSEEAKIPENAELSVKEITPETDKEAYEACLEQAEKQVTGDEKSALDQTASRFFDIEILVRSTGDEEGESESIRKIEPAAPVSVNIQITGSSGNSESASGSEKTEQNDPTVLHFAEEGVEQIDSTVKESKEQKDGEGQNTEVQFEAESFSIYGVVYTVDFHYEINGKMYEFSIPGGGFVSLEHLVEVLGIATGDENTENGAENAENGTENGNDFVGEVPGVDVSDENGTAYEEAIKLNEVEVSETTKKFVADVESVEFSSPELVWVGKVDSESTVGGLKEANGLEVEYSAELTEEQIAEINAQTVEAGDWALISMLPFTSEESLTVTMKNGDQFVVKVTDAQISTHVITADGEDYIITVTYGPEAGIPDGAKLEAEEILEGTEAYENYFNRAMEALHGDIDSDVPEYIHDQVASARFFDISILSEGSEIEPEALVSVTITYAGKVMSESQDIGVVHFAESGIEVLNAEAGFDEEKTSIRFDQSSFSVTGTIVNYRDIDTGEYYIVHTDGAGHWYALAHNGTYVDVTGYYNDASASISGYSNSDSIAWEVSTSGSGYVIKAKGENKYITLNGTVTGSSPTVLQLHSGSSGSKNTKITIDGSYNYYQWVSGHWSSVHVGFGVYVPIWVEGHWEYYQRDYQKNALGWQNGYVANSATSYVSYDHTYYNDADATDVQFAKLSEDSEVVNTDWPNNTYNEQQLQTWLEQALNKEPLKEIEKIGYVYDYDNRIYEIDFSAKSGVLAIANDLSLAFVTDVSNSMLFPSSLTPVSGKTSVQMKTSSFDGLDTSKVYFTIGDKSGTSTVYALYYSNGWKAMDASYYARWKAPGVTVDTSGREISITSSAKGLHKNDTSNNTTGGTPKTGLTYTIYTPNDGYLSGISSGNIYDMSQGNMGNRLYYLETSVDNAVSDMKSIAAAYPMGGVYVGLETFAATVQDDSDGYLKIGGKADNMTAANNTYAANYTSIYNMLKSIEGADGTRQDLALNDLETNLGSPSAGTDKYVILITDGAPNPSDKMEDVISKANALKAKGYTVITVGLSTGEVAIAPEMLWRSASFVDKEYERNYRTATDEYSRKNKAKYYYYAESGDDLTWILREIVRSLMKEATVSATVTDEIDDLFYPVSKDGEPFDSGEWINLSGEKVSASSADAAGQVNYDSTSGTWKVTWTSQEMPWGGWHGSVFVKAKEDFMGGNNVSTNEQASIVPMSYTVNKGQSNENTAYFSATDQANKTVHPATPYVNVDELHLTQNSTEWTVYLGTEVDPAEQLTALWNNVKVNTVVKTDGMSSDYDYTINSDGSLYYTLTPGDNVDDPSPESGVETIDLSHYIPTNVLTSLLEDLKDNQTTSTVVSDAIPYSPYGQGQVGTFTVSISKVVNEEAKDTAPESHSTEKVGSGVESYTLKVNYVPSTEAARKDLLVRQGKVDAEDTDYQHHGGHGAAKEALEAESTNTHIINVFAKKLELLKVDQAQQTITGDNAAAEFGLYRKATETEKEDASVTKVPLSGLTGNYVLVKSLTTEDGKVTTDLLPLLKGQAPYDESYYLVETKSPAGYIMFTEPLKVTIDLSDHNNWGRYTAVTEYEAGVTYYTLNTETGEFTEETIGNQAELEGVGATVYKFITNAQTKPDPYTLSDWLQEATIIVTALDNTNSSSAIRVIPQGEHGITYDHVNDTTDAFVTYKIINNAGVELPATGGPGTTAFYLLGIMLTGLAGAGLVMKRRRKAA